MSLEELPVELLQAILKELCPRDLAVLSSISRPIYPVTMRELYTSITLKKREQSRLLAKSLKHRPAKASFVKYLLKSRRADSDAIKVLPDIVKHLDQLKHFEITADETSFKRLTLLTDLQPIGDLVDFIVGRHPNLQELHLSPRALCGDKVPTLALTKLEEFVGPSWCFSRQTVEMPLLQVSIAWSPEAPEAGTKDIVTSLATSCRGTLKVLCCSKRGLEISGSAIINSPSTVLRLAESSK